MISLFREIRCLECGHHMPADPFAVTCSKCGSYWLNAEYECTALPDSWQAMLKKRPYTMWRYRELFPFADEFVQVTMGEGWTPLVRAAGLEHETGHVGLWIKDERQHATSSFKDRQASVAVSSFKEQGIDEVVLASTGNAAAAYAAYCARAGIKLWIFVTSSVPAEKMRELALYGAEVVKITGTYDEAKQVAADFSVHRGIHLDRGAKSIPCKESMKTLAFEIAEQMPRAAGAALWQAPDWYVQAVSGGIGPLGALKGFEELKAAGFIDRVPKIAVVQTEGCSPMVQAWEQGLDEAGVIEQPDSLITVLSTGKPGLAYKMLKQASDRYGGAMVAVRDGEAFRAMRRVARLEGYSMEPAASVAFAGLDKLLAQGYIQPGEKVVINCSGHTFSAEKYALEDKYIFNLSINRPGTARPADGLAAALEELDEQIMTIVIIDDNPNDSRLIRRLLQGYKNYRIFEANDPLDGVELVRQRKPDLVVLDLMMPGMDGFSVMQALKADPRTSKIPVVIVSAKTLNNIERERIQTNAESVWQKGNFSVQDLVNHMVGIVEKDDTKPLVSRNNTVEGDQTLETFGKGVSQRILVVDDYVPEARLLYHLLATRRRFEVMVAHSGAEAMQVIRQMPPDLVVLDPLLPDISGEELLVMWRNQQSTRDIPVVIMTSQDLDSQTRLSLGGLAESIWSKSALDRSSFLAHIEQILPE